jgi:hypothetical protein
MVRVLGFGGALVLLTFACGGESSDDDADEAGDEATVETGEEDGAADADAPGEDVGSEGEGENEVDDGIAEAPADGGDEDGGEAGEEDGGEVGEEDGGEVGEEDGGEVGEEDGGEAGEEDGGEDGEVVEPECGNGTVESGEACDGDAPRFCETACGTAGLQGCVDCSWETACASTAAESCDGVDNDCDAETDEGYTGLGVPCDGPDADLCENGRVVCTADGTGTECGPESARDIVEACDGMDNDCDTATDEGFAGLGTRCDGVDVDLCANGLVVCTADGTGTECGLETPRDIREACDGADNDCDGATDEAGADGCTVYYADADGDGYGDPGARICSCRPDPAFPVTDGTDCCDIDGQAYPGQTGWFGPTNWCDSMDYDCSGVMEVRYPGTALGSCVGAVTCDFAEGWSGGIVPGCGEVRRWVSSCGWFFGCFEQGEYLTQGCH